MTAEVIKDRNNSIKSEIKDNLRNPKMMIENNVSMDGHIFLNGSWDSSLPGQLPKNPHQNRTILLGTKKTHRHDKLVKI